MDDRLREHAVSIISKLLLDRTGQTLSEDRRWRIDRAIDAVLRKRGIPCSSTLIALLTEPDSDAVERDLVEALLNNETYFYRDRQVFAQLAGEVLPGIARAKAAVRKLNIWSAGCSTGQEALSLAMIFVEQAARWRGWAIRIHATDVSHSAIATARAGVYSQFEIQRGLAVGQMLEHFEDTPQGWRAKSSLTRLIRFEVGNLLDGPPLGLTFDLVLCRNLLLYFNDAAKRLACRQLAAGMAPHARLLLGSGETMVEPGSGFVPAGDECALYCLASETGERASSPPERRCLSDQPLS